MDLRMHSRGRHFPTLPAALAGAALLLWGASAASYDQEFDNAAPTSWILGSGWSVQGTPEAGRYLGAPVTSSPTYSTYSGATWSTNYAYTVRLRTTGPATARVGAVFNYQNASNFYEVTVNEAGNVSLNRMLAGVRTNGIATATYSMPFSPLPSNRYGDLQVLRLGSDVTVRINGMVALTHTLVPSEVFTGGIGVVSQNDAGQFDFAVVANAATPLGPSFPRIGTARISGTNLTQTAVQNEIGKADVALITWGTTSGFALDPVVQAIHTNSRRGTKVILYTKMQEANFLQSGSEKTEADVYAMINGPHNWWVRNVAGAPLDANYKPGTFELVNITRLSPEREGGLTFARWFAHWVEDHYVAPNPSIDGIYMDNASWKMPTSAATSDPALAGDWNVDGVGDPGTRADIRQAYRRGFRDFFDEMAAAMGASKFKFANVGTWGQTTPADNGELAEYYGAVHGGVIETLIDTGNGGAVETWGGWLRMMETYRKVLSTMAGSARLAMFLHGLPTATSWQEMRYGLASCLLDDGYYTPFIGSSGYSTTPWFDEYDANLGQATSLPPTQAWDVPKNVWRRDFQNGIVLVNPKGNPAVTVTVEPGFHRIDGQQDHTVNNGQPAGSITLQPRDGIILLRD
jgi:hypothetical protein